MFLKSLLIKVRSHCASAQQTQEEMDLSLTSLSFKQATQTSKKDDGKCKRYILTFLKTLFRQAPHCSHSDQLIMLMGNTTMSNVPFPLFYSNNSAMCIYRLRDGPPRPDQLSIADFQSYTYFRDCLFLLPARKKVAHGSCLRFTPLVHEGVLPGWSMVGVNPKPHVPSFLFWLITFSFLDRYIQFD